MGHYLVTGGGGFIGSHLTERLLTEGHRVRVFDNFATGRRANIEAVRPAGPARLQVSTADLRDAEAVREAVRGVDGVFHLAALGSVPRSISNPGDTHAVNATGTLNLLVAMRDEGVARMVFAGSSSVYGALEELPKREDHPTVPISPYGLTKLMGEEYLRIFRELFEMETVTLRYYNVFGPRQTPHSQYAAVIPRFIRAFMDGKPPEIHGDGEQSRDFTYVSNVIDANLLAMAAPAAALEPGLFNVALGGRHSINEMVGHLQRQLQVDIKPVHVDPRPGDVRHSQADIGRIRRQLGYEPAVSFDEGLRRTVEYFQQAGAGA